MRSTLPKAVRELTQEFTRLPNIGPKTAQRLAIYLLRQPQTTVQRFAESLKNLHDQVYICKRCFNLAEQETCGICQDQTRNQNVICVVEDALDVAAIEKTDSYHGLYHVLGGVFSPMEGVGIDQLTIHELFDRIAKEDVKELIIALDHNLESDATTRHITTHLQNKDISITRLARGLPTGGDIEFADSTTLTAAIDGRKQV